MNTKETSKFLNKSCFIIAEAGVNHNGDLVMAKRLVDIAVHSGADAVKFQTFEAKALVLEKAPKASYQMATTDPKESQLEMLEKLELSKKDHQALFDYCRQQGICFLSTPFDINSADLLDDLGVPLFKISSGDLTNLPFLAYIAKKKKPMVVSTGMSTLEEVAEAVKVIRDVGNEQITLLHCVSCYPAASEEVNLSAMLTMKETFSVPVGFSDHTLGIEIALAAVALGACVIEKHFTLDRNLSGPDHRASLEPTELANMVRGIRLVEKALGNGKKVPTASETEVAAVARKSLVAAHNISAGSCLVPFWVEAKRPGTGLRPSLLVQLLGKKAKKNIAVGTMLTWDMFE